MNYEEGKAYLQRDVERDGFNYYTIILKISPRKIYDITIYIEDDGSVGYGSTGSWWKKGYGEMFTAELL